MKLKTNFVNTQFIINHKNLTAILRSITPVFISEFDANEPKKGIFVKWKYSAKSVGTDKTFHHQF